MLDREDDSKPEKLDTKDEELEHIQQITIKDVFKLKCPDFKTLIPYSNQNCTNHRYNYVNAAGDPCRPDDDTCGYARVIEENEVILADIIRKEDQESKALAYERAGPRKKLYFNPRAVRAGIVTCGGLCPGLNNVIREIVHALLNLYNVEKVYGFRGGYGGIYTMEPLELTLEAVAEINMKGGTILSSARGGFDEERIISKLKELKINQLYIIGGDGTMRGALKLHQVILEEAEKSGHPIAISGIPKTIDNDIDIVDRSFGFTTAVSEACRAILSAKTEAMCVPNGIGVVKVMGRHAGFIAIHACLASGYSDLCLIPEVPISLIGENSCLKHIERVLARKGHAVIVVAEGAGENLLGQLKETDEGGNRRLPPIGIYLKEKIKEHFNCLPNPLKVEVKYIDPSYMIRSVPANASDSLLCLLMAQNAVHGTMAGFTGFCTALCNNRTVYLPLSAVAKGSPRRVNPRGRMYERLLTVTGQPPLPDGFSLD